MKENNKMNKKKQNKNDNQLNLDLGNKRGKETGNTEQMKQ